MKFFDTTGAISLSNQIFSEQELDISVRDVACDGSESNLLDCNLNSRQTFCNARDDAGAVCQGTCQQINVVFTIPSISTPLDISTPPGNCTHGEVRLVDGRSTSATKEGRLEVCFNDAWGTVCNSSFGFYDAVVACGQMIGFHGEGKEELLTC